MFKAFISSLSPADLLNKVRSLSDPDEVDPASETLFPGTQPVVGHVGATQFVWQKRPPRPWGLWLLNPACWFRPFLTVTVHPHDHGSELRLEGGAAIIAKVLWALAFTGTAVTGGVITALNYPATINFSPGRSGATFGSGLVLTGLLQGLLLLLPAIGWFLTRHDLKFMAGRLEQNLALKPLPYRALAPE